MSKKFFAKCLSLLLTVLLVAAVVPMSVFTTVAVNPAELTVGVLTDVHYYPRSMMGSDINEFIEACKTNSSTSYLTEALLDAALSEYERQSAEKEIKYLLLPGDLSRNGEYEAHKALAKKLKAFEDRTGIQILVINGNHDIRKGNSSRFLNGEFVPSKWCEPEDFRNIYADLGYDLADSFFTPSDGRTAGYLSYAADLEGGYRLIALDGACYSSDIHSKGLNEAETRGAFSDELLEWALNEIRTAKAQGKTVIGMTHFNVVEHYEHEDNTMQAFPLDNWQEVCEKLADAGMNFTFTGHLHFHDIAQWTSDNGETMTDCATASMSNFPNCTRTVTFDNTVPGTVKVDYKTNDIDASKQIEAYGTTYDVPFKYTSYSLNYGGGDLTDFGVRYVKYFLEYSIGPDIKKVGLYNYLDNLLDFDSVIDGLLKNTSLGQAEGITKTSLKAVLKMVCAQLQERYIDNPENAYALVEKVLNKLTSIEVSEYPCTKFIDTYGFGDPNRKGTFGDAVASVLVYMYTGDEDRSGDAFLNDVLDKFYRGENADKIYNTLYDIVINDILKDELLPTIKIEPVKLAGIIGQDAGIDVLSDVLGGVFDSVGDSVPALDGTTIASVVFALGVTDYSSVEDLIDSFLDKYMTDAEMETIAYEFYNFIYDFTTDKAPKDNNETVIYSGKVPVTPTIEALRLPSGVSVTFGSDPATSRNISWFTKVGVEGTDIEIIPASSGRNFTGTPTTNGVSAQTERTKRQFPGIDLGIFGILQYPFNINRHYITLTGLKPGTKYYYRIGDASRQWWSNVGIIDTADNSNEFTFFHFSDSQGGIERQYQRFADTVAMAYNMYPDSAFIMHTGDLVDKGNNFKQWNWLYNTASNNVMKSVLMPTAGNHEKSDDAIMQYNMLSNVPSQNTETGVYYSFDYNNAHFMVLNSNDTNADGALSDKQVNWLRQDASASNAQWKIVSIHKAVYSSGTHSEDDDIKTLQNQLTSLLPELGIDLVLQGHEHVYSRTGVIKDNQVVETTNAEVYGSSGSYNAKVKPEGTIYATDGSSGAKFYNVKDESNVPMPEKTVELEKPMFSAIHIVGDRLFFDAYSVDNGTATKVDSFAIAKSLTKEEAKRNHIDDKSIINDDNSKSTASASQQAKDVNSPKTYGEIFNIAIYAVPIISVIVIVALIIKRRREMYVWE